MRDVRGVEMETSTSDMANDTGIVTKLSPRSVNDTVSRLTTLLAERGMKVFAIVDHSGEARAAGLELRDTKVVIFGNPKGGTPIMDAAPLAALDLPLKVLVWDDAGQTKASYAPPAALAARYGFGAELAANLAGINVITDDLVA